MTAELEMVWNGSGRGLIEGLGKMTKSVGRASQAPSEYKTRELHFNKHKNQGCQSTVNVASISETVLLMQTEFFQWFTAFELFTPQNNNLKNACPQGDLITP
jgi:hypothetical protein